MSSMFSAVEMAPRDPILGLNEQFNSDPNPQKVNLGVGVYTDDNGKLPLLECVAAAEKQLLEAPKARGYLPIDGIAAYGLNSALTVTLSCEMPVYCESVSSKPHSGRNRGGAVGTST